MIKKDFEGVLPQGAPTSPAIANLIFNPIDDVIIKLSIKNEISYTRYADDLSFSSQKPIKDSFRNKIVDIVNSKGFSVNPSKTRLMGPACRREVTGLTINEKVSIPRKKRRELRSLFHHVDMKDEITIESYFQLKGYISWIVQFHPKEATRYKEILDRKKPK